MKRHLAWSVVVVCGLAVSGLAVACSDAGPVERGSSSTSAAESVTPTSFATTTTVKEAAVADAGSSEETPTTAGAPTSEQVDDVEFADLTENLSREIAAADDDICRLLGVFTESTPVPANAGQARAAIGVLVDLLNRIAAVEGVPQDAASVLRSGAAALPAEAAEVGYDPARMTTMKTITSPELGAALSSARVSGKCT